MATKDNKKVVKKSNKLSSAEKAFKRDEVNRLRNKSRKSRVKTYFKKVTDAINLSKSNEEILNLLSEAKSEMGRAVTKNVIHRNTAARKVSRLSKKLMKK